MKYIKKIKDFDLEKWWNKFSKNIKKEDILILITVGIFGLVNYFYFMSNIVLTPDGLTYGPFYYSGGWDFDLGRPLLIPITMLKGNLISPTITVFFSLIFIAISAMLLRRIYPIKSKMSIFLLSLLLVLFPSFSETALFLFCFDAYCLSFLLSVLGIYFIRKKKYLFSIGTIVVSTAIYQAYIGVTITGLVILFILDILDKKENLKEFIIQMFVVLGGLIAYFVLLKFGMLVFHRTLADYKGASSFGLETILLLPKSIFTAYKDFISFFFLENIIFNNYYLRNIINGGILLLVLVLLFFGFKKLKTSGKLLLILSIIILPITISIMDLIASSTSITLVTATAFFMIYLLFIILFEKYANINIIKSVGIVLLLMLSYTYLFSNNGTFQSRMDTFRDYYAESSYYLTKAKSLENYSSDLPWMFNNINMYTSEVLKASNGFLARDYETFTEYLGITENEAFFRRFLGETITVIPEEKYREIIKTEEYKNMKLDEVKIIDGVIVVKVSEVDY